MPFSAETLYTLTLRYSRAGLRRLANIRTVLCQKDQRSYCGPTPRPIPAEIPLKGTVKDHHFTSTVLAEVGVGSSTNAVYFLLTAFFRSAPAENFGTFLAGILIAAPV